MSDKELLNTEKVETYAEFVSKIRNIKVDTTKKEPSKRILEVPSNLTGGSN